MVALQGTSSQVMAALCVPSPGGPAVPRDVLGRGEATAWSSLQRSTTGSIPVSQLQPQPIRTPTPALPWILPAEAGRDRKAAPQWPGHCKEAAAKVQPRTMSSGVSAWVLAPVPEDDAGQTQEECSSASSHYSSETLESCKEEEEVVVKEECQLAKGEPSDRSVPSAEFQAVSLASESHPVSKKPTPSFDDGDEPVSPLDSVAVEAKLNEMWIQVVKAKKGAAGQLQAGLTSPVAEHVRYHGGRSPYYEDVKPEVQRGPAGLESESLPLNLPEVAEASKGALDALQSFCATERTPIGQQRNPQEAWSGRQQRLGAEKPRTLEMNSSVLSHVRNRLYLQNPRVTPNKASAVKEHENAQCLEYTKKKGEVGQKTFRRKKISFMDSALHKEKMEERRHAKDLLSLIEEVHQSLPRLPSDPEAIWKRWNSQGHVG
ncbi:uncharacterized protein C8orf48 homolog isoform X1 [Monodelphis domestica]|uniref:uncharacterized protein C8orf48 homolog isoform X1 n=2 Tax=Monodelphis domestica TaxID=13616 RepID=UPI0024E25686|nr:uncharacterized protein C8orf48 homolog isoform X1 [Monodelphis domestica]